MAAAFNLGCCDSVLFDLDGTLWSSTDVVVRAWGQVLESHGRHVTEEDIHGVMGLQLPEIGEKLFPDVKPSIILRIMEECCELECRMIRQEGGVLFPGLTDMLEKLSARLPLMIVSNCHAGYIEAFLAYHRLGKYFRDYEYARVKGFSKGDNIRSVVQRNGLKTPCYVGDTIMDERAAEQAGVPFIFAAYGFGCAERYAARIERPMELVNLLSDTVR